MHWMAIAVGLWMTFPAQAEIKTSPSPEATANGALALEPVADAAEPVQPAAEEAAEFSLPEEWFASEAPEPPVEAVVEPEAQTGSAPASAPISASRAAPLPGSVPELKAPSAAGAETVQAPQRTIPRAGRVSSESSAERPAAGAGQARGAAATTPWYRTPHAALGAVLGLIVMVTILARRFLPATRPVSPEVLRVVGRASIAPRQSAVLVHVGRRLVLVGVGPEAMRTLAEITDAQEVAYLLGKAGTARPDRAFDALLAAELANYESEEDAAAEDAPAETAMRESLRATRGQLESLRTRIRAMQSA